MLLRTCPFRAEVRDWRDVPDVAEVLDEAGPLGSYDGLGPSGLMIKI